MLLFDGANWPHFQRGLAPRMFRTALVSGPVSENAVRSTACLTGPRTAARRDVVQSCHSARDKKEGNGFLKFLKRKKTVPRLPWVLVFTAKISEFGVITGLSEGASGGLARTGAAPVEPAAWLTSRANNSFCYSTVFFFFYEGGVFLLLCCGVQGLGLLQYDFIFIFLVTRMRKYLS